MPYIIAIVLVAIAALVFFSRPSTTESTPELTNENVIAPTEQAAGTEADAQTEASAETTSDSPNTQEATDMNDSAVEADAGISTDTTLPTMSAVTLSGDAAYLTPSKQEHELAVTLNLDDSIVTAATIAYNGGDAKTPQHKAFDSSYKTEIIGKNVNNISLSRVGGASLTTEAFNQAVAEIRSQL